MVLDVNLVIILGIVILTGKSRRYYGKPVPDRDFTREISPLLITPSRFTSSRKFEKLAAVPDCDFVWLISAEFTAPSALAALFR